MKREPIEPEVAQAAIVRNSTLIRQLMEDVPAFLTRLIEIDAPEDMIEEFGDMMHLIGETMGTMAIIVRYAYKDTVDK